MLGLASSSEALQRWGLIDGVRVQESANSRGSLTATVDFEFFAQVVHVVLDRRGLDSQLARDLLVGEPAIDQMRDL